MKKKPKDLFKKSISRSGVANMDDLVRVVRSNAGDKKLQNLGFKISKEEHKKFKFITLMQGIQMNDVMVNLVRDYNKKHERFLKK